MRFLLRHFFRGLLVVVPVAATLWILYVVFDAVDDLIPLPAEGTWTVPWLEWEIRFEVLARRGVGFLLVVAVVTLVGLLTSNILTRWIFRRIDGLFTRLPVVKLLYSSIKDMIEAFVSDKKKFDKPVLLRLDGAGDVRVIGFVTQDDLDEFGLPGSVAVYVPQSYNFAANLVLVPRDRIEPIDLPSAGVMAFVVSGGVSKIERPDDEES